jgi:CRISPR-associated protein Cmr5
MTPRSHTVAARAYARVAERKGYARRKEYGALAHKLPPLILQNGLAQATGFLLAKGSETRPEHHALLDDLAAVLHASGTAHSTDRNAFHEQVIAADLAATVRLTRRALEAAGWLKRYVQGVLRVDATGAAEGD